MTRKEQLEAEWSYQKDKWKLHDWKLKFSNHRRTLGYCDCRKKVISLSLKFMELNPFPVMKETLLHEIAHAVQFRETGVTNHKKGWRERALIVGCEPVRCAAPAGLNIPPGKYVGICTSCELVTHFYRKVNREYFCRICYRKTGIRCGLKILSYDEYSNL